MTTTATSTFAEEINQGLSTRPRHLSSKWFYDANGDKLFQAIMAMPEYYLTDSEREIYQTCGPALLEAIGNRPFDLIELGAGDGSKTQYLIDHFIEAGANFTYRPIDISANAIKILGAMVAVQWPNLPFAPINDDYFAALDRLGSSNKETRRLVLFPGANIGNFTQPEAGGFLRHLKKFLRPGDLLLTGFDLKKDPDAILAAYNDPAGHTADFNLNLLRRINRELGGDFNLTQWRHWESYDPASGATRSFLVSRSEQDITIKALDKTFSFDAWEAISVEISQKYSKREIETLAQDAGFTHQSHFQDERGWFSDSLWLV
ncbi:MAG: L-histidine N-alpha-methyltransferase [Neolewinella sp.]|jgi:dimethylhistidine N-methyltransferase